MENLVLKSYIVLYLVHALPICCRERWRSGLCEAGIILLSVIAYLFSTAQKISVEKDWISVIAEGDGSELASKSVFFTVNTVF